MKRNQNERILSQKIFLPIIMASLMTSASVMAKPFWSERGSHMAEKFEHLIERLDLNDEQEKKAQLILSDLRPKKNEQRPPQAMWGIMNLNPEDSGYLDKVNEHADQAAEHVKSKIVQMAKAKKDLYGILDDEQKAKISMMMEQRLKKHAKRMKEKED